MLENVTAYICHSNCFGLLISGKPAPLIVYCEVHCIGDPAKLKKYIKVGHSNIIDLVNGFAWVHA